MAVTHQPKYEQIKQSLIAELRSGRWTAGSEFPSEAQLLKRYKVSRPTLIRSLQEMVREGYLHRHQGRGTFVANPKPDRQTSILPVFVSTQTTELFGGMREVLLQIMRGVQNALGPYHSGLVVHQSPGESVDEQTHAFVEHTQPGAALMIQPSFNPKLFSYLVKRGWVMWAINEPIDYGNCVFIDQQQAGYLATQYLLDKGCKRIALLNGLVDAYWGFGARLRGYREALDNAGIDIDPKLLRQGDHALDSEAGRSMMRSLLDEKTSLDGVVGVSDRKTMGAMAAAGEAGISIPDDITFASIDNTLAQRSTLPLASVALPFEQAGWQAAVQALEGGTSHSPGDSRAFTRISLQPTLIKH
jgi:DNA-binding LacI/PurR family transcriptional regulator